MFVERRRLLDELAAEGRYCRVSRLYDDGEALAWAVHDRGLEGVVAKRLSEPYRPGERS